MVFEIVRQDSVHGEELLPVRALTWVDVHQSTVPTRCYQRRSRSDASSVSVSIIQIEDLSLTCIVKSAVDGSLRAWLMKPETLPQ